MDNKNKTLSKYSTFNKDEKKENATQQNNDQIVKLKPKKSIKASCCEVS